MTVEIIVGDCLTSLRSMPERSVQMCVTSPPYWGLRDYGVEGQLGLEKTPEEYVARMVDVFREVKRVLRDDGTLWLNLGDSYATNTKGQNNNDEGGSTLTTGARPHVRAAYNDGRGRDGRRVDHGLKTKDLVGIPWRVAFALQADGWYLRSDIIWHKPNPMPESVTDRPTKSHEYLFLLSKSERYYYDAGAVKEPGAGRLDVGRMDYPGRKGPSGWTHVPKEVANGRNRRSVWTIATQPYKGAHFATFPPKLIEPCILAGSRPDDTVLDPFGGSGTTGAVALQHGRRAILLELNPAYADLARERIGRVQPALVVA